MFLQFVSAKKSVNDIEYKNFIKKAFKKKSTFRNRDYAVNLWNSFLLEDNVDEPICKTGGITENEIEKVRVQLMRLDKNELKNTHLFLKLPNSDFINFEKGRMTEYLIGTIIKYLNRALPASLLFLVPFYNRFVEFTKELKSGTYAVLLIYSFILGFTIIVSVLLWIDIFGTKPKKRQIENIFSELIQEVMDEKMKSVN